MKNSERERESAGVDGAFSGCGRKKKKGNEKKNKKEGVRKRREQVESKRKSGWTR